MAAQPIQAAGAVRPDAVNWNPSAVEISAYEQGGSLVSMDISCWQLDGSLAKAARSAMCRPARVSSSITTPTADGGGESASPVSNRSGPRPCSLRRHSRLVVGLPASESARITEVIEQSAHMARLIGHAHDGSIWDLLVILTRNSHALTTPPTRLVTAAGISQYKPPPALTRKVNPAMPTSTAVTVFGENFSM